MASATYQKVSSSSQEQAHQEDDENMDSRQTGSPSLENELDPVLPLPTQSAEYDEGDVSTSNITCSVDEAIERLGMGRFQLVILTAAGLCFAADAMQVLQLTFLSEVLRLEWNLNDDETALITSMLFIGAIFGTLTLGPLADKKGRKPVFILAASIISVFGVAVALVSNYIALLGNPFEILFQLLLVVILSINTDQSTPLKSES